jgi:hypothetical protein
MVAISGAPSKAKYASAGAAESPPDDRIATKTPGPRKPKFGQQSFVAAVAAPVGASSVIRSRRREVEVRVLCAGAVIGEAERFHNQFI